MISELSRCLDAAGLVAVTYRTFVADPVFDGDGTVGFGDFVLFAAKFGSKKSDARYDARFDLDGNGTNGFLVSVADFGKKGRTDR